MTPEAAAWVEQHVITDYHLANEGTFGGPQQDADPMCPCQLPCYPCRSGRHQACLGFHAAAGDLTQQRPETHLRAPAPWRPPDPKRPLYTAVWLADRGCRPLCDCTTCQPVPVAAGIALPEPPARSGGQLELFAHGA
ncbi:hypothetical protein ACFQ61_10195 [Streptomyces sp. NPDC056500]|uniref:hypothetical protein n=1 Tax=Streptomyces sp. NPDC056500 TaxID=3345840 RepID=UPI0036BAA383